MFKLFDADEMIKIDRMISKVMLKEENDNWHRRCHRRHIQQAGLEFSPGDPPTVVGDTTVTPQGNDAQKRRRYRYRHNAEKGFRLEHLPGITTIPARSNGDAATRVDGKDGHAELESNPVTAVVS